MTADFLTEIILKGSKSELLSMIKVLKEFEDSGREQFIENVCVQGRNNECYIADMDDDEIEAFISEAGKKLTVQASGPWGDFYSPVEVGIFEALAEAAPEAYFEGDISGEAYEFFKVNGTLMNGMLSLTDCESGDVDSIKKRIYDPIAKTYRYVKVEED